jgi:hypothetical protein
MPIGDLIGEILLRGIFEIILYTVFYYTGAVVIWIFTLGQLRIAPLSSIETTNRGKNRWNDWSIWLHRPFQERLLKAECVIFVGLLFWIAFGIGLYFLLKEK